VSTEWFDYIEDDPISEDAENTLYCPYTNSDQCALLVKGLQPQELCAVLECPQLKLFQRHRPRKKRHQAA
jgi:hypothetical protein